MPRRRRPSPPGLRASMVPPTLNLARSGRPHVKSAGNGSIPGQIRPDPTGPRCRCHRSAPPPHRGTSSLGRRIQCHASHGQSWRSCCLLPFPKAVSPLQWRRRRLVMYTTGVNGGAEARAPTPHRVISSPGHRIRRRSLLADDESYPSYLYIPTPPQEKSGGKNRQWPSSSPTLVELLIKMLSGITWC
ncbi:hypothetical protein ACQJBY_003300 [Aegilops geniculata]